MRAIAIRGTLRPMILAAIVVGLITAYYLGLRAGGIAAGAAAALFLLVALYPPLKFVAYLAIGLGVAAVCIAGPYHQKPETRRQVQNGLKWLRRALGYAKRQF